MGQILGVVASDTTASQPFTFKPSWSDGSVIIEGWGWLGGSGRGRVKIGILNQITYHVSYRNDGLKFFKGKKNAQDLIYWLEKFQQIVDKVVGNLHLQVTEDIWKEYINLPPSANKDNVQTVVKN